MSNRTGFEVKFLSLPGRLIAAVALFFLAAFCCMRVEAQASAGLGGTVTDATGGVVPKALVDIANNATGTVQHATTSDAGTFAVSGLQPGTYTVTVTSPGFTKLEKRGVLIEIGTQGNVNFSLAVGSTDTVVSVEASSISLNTTQPQIGTTIEPELLNALPDELSGRGREVANFEFLAPGVQGSTFTTEISGGVSFQQEVVYNGVPMAQPETQGLQVYIDPPYELVKEFRVQTSTFSAQYGLAQGAVNYQTASGTNKFHGDAFEINRNSSFDSRGFVPLNPPVVPVNHENNYGFSFEGPIWIPKVYNGKDKAFFHVSAEWFKQNATATGSNDTVPTTQERMGDFSDFVNGSTGALIPIFDPTTGQQFQSNGKLNVIPTSRISAASQSVLQYLPSPNRTGVNIGGLDQNRSYDPYPIPVINHNWGYTLDYALTSKQSLHWTEWRDSLSQSQAFVLGPLVAPPNPLASVAQEPQLGTGFIINYAYALTPHLVMTAGISLDGEIQNQLPITKASESFVENGVYFPEISFDGNHAPTQWSNSLQASINRKLGLDYVNNWLWTKGRNTFNFGGEARRTYMDALQNNGGAGHFAFSHNETSDPGGTSAPNFANDGSAFASFLLGTPDAANRTFAEEVKMRNFDLSPYVQDDFKVTPKLTVNLGLRWDIMVPFTTEQNNVAFLNPTLPNSHTGTLGSATQTGTCSTTCVGWTHPYTHWKNFGPRVGFAYMLTPKTVIQSGFSIAFLNGGSYAYGPGQVADDYSNILAGAYTLNSSGSNVSNYGSWDAKPLPSPASTPIGPTSGINNAIYELPYDSGRAAYTEQWNVNIQRELPYDLFFTIAYVGNRELHIFSDLNNPNEYPDSALALGSKLDDSFFTGTAQADGFTVPYPNFIADLGPNATVHQALSTFPQYTSVTNNFEDAGTAFYNGMQTQLEKRYTNGIALLSSLTISREMSSNDFGLQAPGFEAIGLDKFRQKQEWAVSGNDQKYNFKLSGTYELPIGRKKRFLNNHGFVSNLIGGLRVSGILDYEGGAPYGIGQTGDPGDPNGSNRPDRVSGVHLSTYSYSRVKDYALGKTSVQPQMFNQAAFATTGNYFILGNASRNYSSLRGSPYRNENLTASKAFAIGEHVRAKLQVDFYNAFNRAILSSNPNTTVNSVGANPSFGLVTGISQQNSNRQGQGTLRLEF